MSELLKNKRITRTEFWVNAAKNFAVHPNNGLLLRDLPKIPQDQNNSYWRYFSSTIPYIVKEGNVRQKIIQQLYLKPYKLKHLKTYHELLLGMRDISYIAQLWMIENNLRVGNNDLFLPHFIAKPLYKIAKILNIPPFLSYIHMVIANARIHKGIDTIRTHDLNIDLFESECQFTLPTYDSYNGRKSYNAEELYIKANLLIELFGAQALNMIFRILKTTSVLRENKKEILNNLSFDLNRLKEIIHLMGEKLSALHEAKKTSSHKEKYQNYYSLPPQNQGVIFEGINDKKIFYPRTVGNQSPLLFLLSSFYNIKFTDPNINLIESQLQFFPKHLVYLLLNIEKDSKKLHKLVENTPQQEIILRTLNPLSNFISSYISFNRID